MPVTFSPGRKSSFEVTVISDGEPGDAFPKGKWNAYSKLEDGDFPQFVGLAEEIKTAVEKKEIPSHWEALQ